MSRGSSYSNLDDRVFLNSPWVCLQPADFGVYSGDLLVGNFGDGTILAFDPAAHRAIDYLRDTQGHVISIDGLWDRNLAMAQVWAVECALFHCRTVWGNGRPLWRNQSFVHSEPQTCVVFAAGLAILGGSRGGAGEALEATHSDFYNAH